MNQEPPQTPEAPPESLDPIQEAVDLQEAAAHARSLIVDQTPTPQVAEPKAKEKQTVTKAIAVGATVASLGLIGAGLANGMDDKAVQVVNQNKQWILDEKTSDFENGINTGKVVIEVPTPTETPLQSPQQLNEPPIKP